MAMLLWTSEADDEALDLGDPFRAYSSFADMARAAGTDAGWEDLFSVPQFAEEEVDPAWAAAVARQAARFRLRFGLKLSPHTRWLLGELAKLAATKPSAKACRIGGPVARPEVRKALAKADADFERQHPRGEHGRFAVGGQSVSTGAAVAILDAAEAAGHKLLSVKEAGAALAQRLGAKLWDRLPEHVQTRLAQTYRAAKAAEHLLMAGFRTARALATEAAKERGLPPEKAELVGKLLATADLTLGWAVNMPAVTAATGSVAAGKAASWVPVASLAYLTYSTARDPFATARAARNVIRARRPDRRKSLAADQAKLLYERVHAASGSGPWAEDWYAALFCAALDETRDFDAAVDLAVQGFGDGGPFQKAVWHEDQHPRDEDGRFTDRPGRTGQDLFERIRRDGGFTYSPVHERSPDAGYVVAVYQKHEQVYQLDDVTAEKVAAYLESVRHVFEADPDAHLGGWYDVETGKVYLDVSKVVADKEEAVRLAREHEQEGIYDLGAKQTVITKRPEERRKAYGEEAGALPVPAGRDGGGHSGRAPPAEGGPGQRGAAGFWAAHFLKTAGPHSYASTQVNLPADLARRVLELGHTIPAEDLAEDGREAEGHITVLFGL